MMKQQIISAVLECKEKLGHVPTNTDLNKKMAISRKMVRQHFSNYGQLLAECGLSGLGSGYKAAMDEVFLDWAMLARTLKRLPTIAEYEIGSKFSVRPLVTRFGTWSQAPYGLKLFAEEKGWAEEWKDVLTMVEAKAEQDAARGALMSAPGPENVRRARKLARKQGPENLRISRGDREVYGGLVRPFPLVCAPVNEMGVVFLFGALAEKLGFAVLRIRPEYPDCDALMQVAEDRLERVKIEFEYESRNFLKHMHEANDCDIIVCWKHNWPECPLQVVELRGEIGKLGRHLPQIYSDER
ncbi:MAG TPA: hypothetical protein VGJ33_13355 [Candidatus Angelobacter sp.]|jgi:hypothetical protein